MIQAFILSLLILNPRHELNRDPVLRAEVAGYATAASELYGVEPSLLIYQAYREASLKITSVGRIPNQWGVILEEQGYAQAHGKSKRMCEAAGYDIITRSGGIHCIALLIDNGRRKCGSLQKGLVYYASGNCKGTEKTRKKIKLRLKEWRRRWEKIDE